MPANEAGDAPVAKVSDNTLVTAINDFLAGQGKVAAYGLANRTVMLQDDADGSGPYIAQWSAEALGPWPKQTDGFTAAQLRRSPD